MRRALFFVAFAVAFLWESPIMAQNKKDTVSRTNISEHLLDEITVVGSKVDVGVKSSVLGAIEVPVNQIKVTPTFMGEADVIKMFQALPGVQSGSDGTAKMYVRGGGADENLFLLDGVQIFNPTHSGGFFSVFDPDMLQNVVLYKGAYPTRYGGRLSSVAEISLADGDFYKHRQSLSVGLLSSKVHLQGPLQNGRTSYNLSVRYSYLNSIINKLLESEKFKEKHSEDNLNDVVSTTFYDITAKISHKVNSSNSLSLSFYTGRDYNDVEYKEDRYYNKDIDSATETSEKKLNSWGNMAAIAKWKTVFSPYMRGDFSLKYSDYNGRSVNSQNIVTTYYKEGEPNAVEKINDRIEYLSKLSDITHAGDFVFTKNGIDLSFGYDYTLNISKPGVMSSSYKETENEQESDADLTENKVGDRSLTNHNFSVYVQNDHNITDWLKVNYGLRAGLFSAGEKIYPALDPRVSARVLMSDNLSFKASYSSAQQYVHLLASSNLSNYSDIWVYSTDKVRPSASRQVSAGVNYTRNSFDFSLEGYYKHLDNVIEYKDNVSFLDGSDHWEDKVCTGEAWSYGVEFLAQKKTGKTTGWIAYTWSKSERKFDRPGNVLNHGEKFYAKYDRRHDVKIIVSHKVSERLNLNGAFYYATGHCGDLALEHYHPFYLEDYNFEDFLHGLTIGPANSYTGYYPIKNGFRMPDSHRLDVSVDINFFHKKGRSSIVNLGVYNLYNKANPVVVKVGYSDDIYSSYNKQFLAISYFRIMPSVSYTFNF